MRIFSWIPVGVCRLFSDRFVLYGPSGRQGVSILSLGVVAIQCAMLMGLASCSRESRLSNAELMAAAADYVASDDTFSIVVTTPVEGNAAQLEYHAYDQELYGSGARLIAQNPDCCVVGLLPSDDEPPPRCWGRGSFEIVSVRYQARYRDKDGALEQKNVTRYIGVDQDGVACR